MARAYRREVYRSSRIVVEFEMDRKGMAEIARGKELRIAVRAIAAHGKAYAESIAPQDSGEYKRMFQVAISRITVAGMRRVSAKVVNTHPAAAAIEWGSKASNKHGATPAHRTLQRTLAYLGGRGHQTLSDPTMRPEGGLVPIRTIEQFRTDRARQREADRNRRRRQLEHLRRAREIRRNRSRE